MGCGLVGVSGRDATHYPLGLMAIPGKECGWRFDYRPDLLDREGAEALTGRFIRLLEGAVAAPEHALGRIEILSPLERETILRGWKRHRASYTARHLA
jgi:hypothetical protein